MKSSRSTAGTTLVEMLVNVAIVATAGTAFFAALYQLAVQQAKINAVDFSHGNARILINRAVRQIHLSVSIPALVDANLGAVSGNGPAAGVSYQVLVAGPGYVQQTTGANTLKIVMQNPPTDVDSAVDYDHDGAQTAPGSYTQTTPAVGMRLLVPAFELEDNITAVSGTWAAPTTSTPNPQGTFTITLQHTIPSSVSITTTASGTVPPVITPNYQVYYTYRSALTVNAGRLLYYMDTSKATGTVATDISTGVAKIIATNVVNPPQSPQTLQTSLVAATPFSVPGGNNALIQVNLATYEPAATSRGYKGVDFQTTVTIPYRFRLATFQ